MSMTVTTDNLAKVLATMAQLVKKDVLVGIPDSAPEREEDTPLSNAQIGYILDNGSPKANIPARPFLVPGVENVQPEIVDEFRSGAKAALDGNAAGVERSLARAACGRRTQSGRRSRTARLKLWHRAHWLTARSGAALVKSHCSIRGSSATRSLMWSARNRFSHAVP